MTFTVSAVTILPWVPEVFLARFFAARVPCPNNARKTSGTHGTTIFQSQKMLIHYSLSSRKRPPRLDILGGHLREFRLYCQIPINDNSTWCLLSSIRQVNAVRVSGKAWKQSAFPRIIEFMK